MTTTNSPAAQPQGRELLPCPFCGARARLTIVAEHLAPAENGFPVHVECGGTASCFSHYFEDESAAIRFWNTRADLPRATADGNARKLTLPELNHLLALLESEKESGEYARPREQYYARTERLMKWCQEQING